MENCPACVFAKDSPPGGQSIWGPSFQDEDAGLRLRHATRGVVAMANRGLANTNGSQFYCTVGPAEHLDGKSVILGQIVHGFDIINAVSTVGTKEGTPFQRCVVMDCGVVRRGGVSRQPLTSCARTRLAQPRIHRNKARKVRMASQSYRNGMLLTGIRAHFI